MARKFVCPLIDAERMAGHSSQLVTSSGADQANALNLRFTFTLIELFFLPIYLVRVYLFLKRSRPDIVISHNTTGSLLPLLAARMARIKIRIYFNHGVPYIGHKGLVRDVLYLLDYLNCHMADKIITVSKSMKNILGGINTKKIPQIIHQGSACGIDLGLYKNSQVNNSCWRKSNQISSNDLVVVYIGRPKYRKGFDVAARLWFEHFSDQRFKLVMCGPSSNDVLKIIPHIPENILCLGFVDNVPEILENADILIMPSLHEGLSYAVLEAMASGCVVVGNKIDGVSDLLEDKVNGFLVSMNDLNEYARIIESLALDRALCERVVKAGLISANLYSRNFFVPAYLRYLNNL